MNHRVISALLHDITELDNSLLFLSLLPGHGLFRRKLKKKIFKKKKIDSTKHARSATFN